jgi:hypothetical protein
MIFVAFLVERVATLVDTPQLSRIAHQFFVRVRTQLRNSSHRAHRFFEERRTLHTQVRSSHPRDAVDARVSPC